jgi:hypothetical protein
MANLTEFVKRMLQSSPSEAFCDPCLAFALEAPLTSIQDATKRLAMLHGEYVRTVGACANCGRTTDTTALIASASEQVVDGDRDQRPKCVRCSRRVAEADEELWQGERFHRQCLAILRSQAQIANTRQIRHLSQQLIDHGRALVSSERANPEHLVRIDQFLRLTSPDAFCLPCLGRVFVEISELARSIEGALLRRRLIEFRQGRCAMCRHGGAVVRLRR